MVGDLGEGLLPRTAAPSPDIDVLVPPSKLAHQRAQFLRITLFQMPDLAQLDLVPCGGVGSKHANSLDPVPRLQRQKELERMRPVDIMEVRLCLTTCAVRGLDCFAK